MNLKLWATENNLILITEWNQKCEKMERYTFGSHYKADWKCSICNFESTFRKKHLIFFLIALNKKKWLQNMQIQITKSKCCSSN